MDEKTSTLAIDKETQRLIRQYCFIHKIDVKKFIAELANERLGEFKTRLNELKKIRL